MKYWLIAIPREDMEHCIKIGCYGRNSAAKLLAVESGDKIACYVSKEMKIIALGEVTQGYYQSDKKVFLASERPAHNNWHGGAVQSAFQHRIDFKAVKLDHEIDFRPLIDKLSFIKKPAAWPAYIRRGFATLSEKDWNTICKSAQSPD